MSATTQLRLFPETPLVIKCASCGLFTIFFIISFKPFSIRCNECGCLFDENMK